MDRVRSLPHPVMRSRSSNAHMMMTALPDRDSDDVQALDKHADMAEPLRALAWQLSVIARGWR